MEKINVVNPYDLSTIGEVPLFVGDRSMAIWPKPQNSTRTKPTGCQHGSASKFSTGWLN